MEEDWFARLQELVERDRRSLNQLSKDADVGRNYVQQLMQRGNGRVREFFKLLSELGPGAAFYVVTGMRQTPQTIQFLRYASQIQDEDAFAEVLSIVRRIAGTQNAEGKQSPQERLPAEQDSKSPTADTPQ